MTTTTPTPPLPEGMDFPLDGVRVLDLSRVFAGPLCGQVLADFGADVIKVEHPGRGDDTRDWGMRIGKTETTYYNSMNRNKRSITVDLQTPEGVKIIRDLLPQCDVVIQNFKTGGAEKLGLGYEQLKAIKPDLIYCSVAGYDSSGPEAKRPGYDLVIQGEAGLMALNGEASQPPLKFGVAAVDMMTGMYAAQAVLAALFRRSKTGQGRHIEMALYDCGLMITGYYGLDAMLLGHDPQRYGNAHPSIVPYGVFEAADGPLVITVGNNGQFQQLCAVLGAPDMATDPRFATNMQRIAHRTLQPAPVHAVVGLGVADQRLDGLAPLQPGLLLRGQRLELATVDDLLARVVGVHAPEAQVRHHDLDLARHVLEQVGGLLEHGAEDVAVVRVAGEAACAHHQPGLVRDHHRGLDAEFVGLACLAVG